MLKIIVAVGLAFCNVSWAQQGGFIDIGKFGETKVYVGTGSNANRVGNAVLFYVHAKSNDSVISEQMLASCDTTWVNEHIRSNFLIKEVISPSEAEAAARRDSRQYPLYEVEFSEWQQSSLVYASALKAQIRTLCKGAAAEPKNVSIPVASYVEFAKAPGGSISILTGTTVRKGSVIDAWMRTTYFQRKPVMINGKPFEVEGVVRTLREATGAYELRRTAFDCLNRQMAAYQILEYTEDGVPPKQWSYPREKVQLDIVAPNSVGEVQLEAICRIYG